MPATASRLVVAATTAFFSSGIAAKILSPTPARAHDFAANELTASQHSINTLGNRLRDLANDYVDAARKRLGVMHMAVTLPIAEFCQKSEWTDKDIHGCIHALDQAGPSIGIQRNSKGWRRLRAIEQDWQNMERAATNSTPRAVNGATNTDVNWSTRVYARPLRPYFQSLRDNGPASQQTTRDQDIQSLFGLLQSVHAVGENLKQTLIRTKPRLQDANQKLNFDIAIEALTQACTSIKDKQFKGNLEDLVAEALDIVETCASRIHFVAYGERPNKFRDIARAPLTDYPRNDATIKALKEISISGQALRAKYVEGETAERPKSGLKIEIK